MPERDWLLTYVMQGERSCKDILAQQPIHPNLPLLQVAVWRCGQDLIQLGEAKRPLSHGHRYNESHVISL